MLSYILLLNLPQSLTIVSTVPPLFSLDFQNFLQQNWFCSRSRETRKGGWEKCRFTDLNILLAHFTIRSSRLFINEIYSSQISLNISWYLWSKKSVLSCHFIIESEMMSYMDNKAWKTSSPPDLIWGSWIKVSHWALVAWFPTKRWILTTCYSH